MRYDEGLRMDSWDGRRLAVVPRKGFRRKKANPDIHIRGPDLFDVLRKLCDRLKFLSH